ncbi:hypothetical protein DFH08DRAFT_152243 [Mycena albidolilacea]|uniref:UGGT thioredoxin-like domain-containing protein n=1 Tax=Mycena albidolilacea TaxID=1033008 RepID=A0AAD7A2E6_9AGAR|nr:hypothetical protein DFH08DRAFT_152243 [Mycena albidolilacea]
MHLILSSPSPLTMLKYMRALALRVPRVPSPQPRDELDMNQLKAQAGISVFWLNGATLPEKDVTALGLLRAVRKERALMGALAGLGLGRGKALVVLTHEGVSGALGEGRAGRWPGYSTRAIGTRAGRCWCGGMILRRSVGTRSGRPRFTRCVRLPPLLLLANMR